MSAGLPTLRIFLKTFELLQCQILALVLPLLNRDYTAAGLRVLCLFELMNYLLWVFGTIDNFVVLILFLPC